MGTAGAACATVFAQVVSVVVSFGFIRKKQLPFVFKKENVRIHKTLLKKMAGLGAPIALQDLLVSIFVSYYPGDRKFHGSDRFCRCGSS